MGGLGATQKANATEPSCIAEPQDGGAAPLKPWLSPKTESHPPLTRAQRHSCRLYAGEEGGRGNSLQPRSLMEEKGQREDGEALTQNSRHKMGGSERGRQGINEREENVCFQEESEKDFMTYKLPS